MTEKRQLLEDRVFLAGHCWSKEELLKARDWIFECDWPDIEDADDVRQLTDEQVARGIKRHYGISEFIKDSDTWDVCGDWEKQS